MFTIRFIIFFSGLIPHCLAILKKCHHLTERLVAMMMTYVSQHSNQDLGEIIEVAKKISPRVDDVVKAMYPPLDPRLLEARYILFYVLLYVYYFLCK